jgi:hypothetical protein
MSPTKASKKPSTPSKPAVARMSSAPKKFIFLNLDEEDISLGCLENY